MEEGNQFIRIPIGGKKGTPVKAYQIVASTTGGRRGYLARLMQYSTILVGSEPVLFGSPSGSAITVYNILETNTDGASYRFLEVGDEVEVWQQDGLNLCCEVPRGFN